MPLLPRLHLFEFLDQKWLPETLRRGEVDYLRVVLDRMRPYDSMAPQLAELLRTAGTDRVVDLCSGSGGPWRTLLPALRTVHGQAEVMLTDLHPTPGLELPAGVHYRDTPVDATRIPEELMGVRTLFEGLHHFPPEQARALLWDGVVSSLRTYAPPDLERLTAGIGADGYQWSHGVHRVQGMAITYLIGQPVRPR